MKKSSLGKRSSFSQQGSIIYCNKPAQKKVNDDSASKKSMLLKPGFATKGNRPSSVDRDVTSHFIRREPALRRSKSALNIDVSHIKRESSSDSKRPINMNMSIGSISTPRQSGGGYKFNAALSTGGTRGRNLCSSETRRASSVGEKTRKKESRPIGEKGFQIGAEEKVLNFFSRDDEGAAILSTGHIRPMNTNRFVEMVNYLVRIIDPRIVITKTNYADEISQLAKTYMYKGRMERSLIISVSAAHNWPYVLAFLLWLVEVCMVAEALDPFETMYPIDIQDTEADVNDINFRLLAPHLLNGFNAYNRGSDGEEEINQCMMELKSAEKITDEDIEKLEHDYASLEKESYDLGDPSGGQKLTDIEGTVESLNNEISQCVQFIKNREELLNQITEKSEKDMEKIKQQESTIESLRKKIEELRLRINNQKVSYNEKQLMKQEMEKIKEEIEYLNRCIPEYTDMNYAEDFKLTAVRNQFEKVCLTYNKDVVDNVPFLPQLKQTVINHDILHQNALENSEKIDEILQTIKAELQAKRVASEQTLKEIKWQVEKAEMELMSLKEGVARLKHEYEDVSFQLRMKTKSMEKATEVWSFNMSQLETKKQQLIDSMPDMQYLRNSVSDAEMQLKELQEQYNKFAQESIAIISERTNAVNKKNLALREKKKNWTLEALMGE